MDKVKSNINEINQCGVVDHKDILIEELRRSYKSRMGKPNNRITLPSRILFYKEDRKITIKLSKEVVCRNLQHDEGAFDSWALALKNWLSYVEEIIIGWEKPNDVLDEDYQRFLYRLIKVRDIFPWLKVEKTCEEYLADSEAKNGDVYYVNVPNGESKVEAVKGEAKYERMFINQYKEELAKAAGMCSSKFYNQLPVSLFKGEVNDDSRVFEGFLDIWGIDEIKEELSIFELKKPDNYPLGIISELLFYTLFEKDILDKKIKYSDIDNIKDFRGIKSLINSNHKKIKGYFLTTRLHPLMDQNLIELMNSHLKAYSIQLGSIKYSVDKEGNIKNLKA